MFCEKCGNSLKDTAKFCSKCGTAVEAAPEEEVTGPLETELPDFNEIGAVMTKEEALAHFQNWYDLCVSNGLEPEEVISKMGGMALITDPELVERLEEEGAIPSY